MRARLIRGTSSGATAANMYKQDLYLAEDTGILYARVDAGITACGDGAAVGAQGSQGAQGASVTGPQGAQGADGASFVGAATLTEIGLSTASCTGATSMVGITAGGTLQDLINAIAGDIVLAQNA